MKRIPLVIASIIISIFSLFSTSRGADVEEIKKELEKLKKEVEAIQKEKGARIVATYKDGFIIMSEDGNFKLKINGYVQPQFQGLIDTKDLNYDSFVVRRARVKFTVDIYKNFEFVLQPEFEAKDYILRDAYIDLLHFREAGLRMGQFKIPFSLESLRSSSTIETVEKSMAVSNLRGMGKDRDIGVALHGKLFRDTIEYSLGIFNGTGLNTSDNNDNKDVVGRIVLSPFKGKKGLFENLSFGASLQAGKQEPAAFEPKLNYSGAKKIFSVSPGVDGFRTIGGAEVSYTYGPGAIIAEYIVADFQRRGLSDIRGEGWYLQLSCLITGDRKKTLKDVERGIETVFKIEQIDIDDNGGYPDYIGQTVNASTFGINWYWNKFFKIMADFVLYDIENLNAPGNQYKKANPKAFLVRSQLKF